MPTIGDSRGLRRGPVRLRRLGTHYDPAARDDLDRGIIHTEISPALARIMTAAFLVLIMTVPLLQTGIDLLRRGRVQALEVFARMPTRENLSGFERELSQQSSIRQAVQPRLQSVLSGSLGFGNTNVIFGRDGWLFYRPGVEFMTGHGFLSPATLRLRERKLSEAGEPHPAADPRPAIVGFHEQCRRAGARLIVVPIPDKSMLHPAELTERLTFDGAIPVPTNPDYRCFVDELRASGVDVFDPTPEHLSPGEAPRFLRQDTHWTPEWMERVARDLASHVESLGVVPSMGSRPFAVREESVSRVGDIVDMLKLPPDQNLFLPQTVKIGRVVDPATGSPWTPSERGEVLLLGDSFSNIYSTPDLGWGESAGFPAQLSRFLKCDVDVIARNGSGASLTRRELARRSSGLAGKKVVVWEFAIRDLMTANWEPIAIGSNPSVAESEQARGADESPLSLEVTVVATSRVPQPFSVPYKDCVTYVKVQVDRVVRGVHDDRQMIAVFWGMKDNVLLPAASYRAGQRLRIKAVPLRESPLNQQSVRRVDDLDDFERSPFYVLMEESLK